jgi:outer membrane biosynthesis protein TonB
MSDDEKLAQRVSQKYRELGAEAPPRALDDAILAAARREAGSRPGLPGRAGRRRWYAPLATAAVLVLAVAVALNMQRESPEIVSTAKLERPAPPAAAPAPAEKDSPKAAAKAEAQPRAAASRAEREHQPEPVARKAPEAFPMASQDKVTAPTSEPAPPPAPAAAPAPATAEMRTSRRDAALESGSSAAGALARPEVAQVQAHRAKAAPTDTPERELERIAGLRHLGMHDEADKALAEFRKHYPDYTIPEAMRLRIERR